MDAKVLKRKARNTKKDVDKFVKVTKRKAKNSIKTIEKILEDAPKKRKAGLLPPKARRILTTDGETIISKIVIVRTPVEGFVSQLMELISLGTYKNAIKSSNYDDMFHLSVFLNDKYVFEKNEVVNLDITNPIKEKSQTLQITFTEPFTLAEGVNRTKDLMGDEKFSNYNAKTNNCQDFILAFLQANNIISNEAVAFVKQDAEKVFEKMPSFTDKIAEKITDIGAVADKLIQGEALKVTEGNKVKGEGKKKKKHEGKGLPLNSWILYFQQAMKGKKFNSKKENNDFMKEVAKKYKAEKHAKNKPKNKKPKAT